MTSLTRGGILRLLCFIAFLYFGVLESIARAYVILPPECQGEKIQSCLERHSLGYIFIYQEISTDELTFFTKLEDVWDEKIPLPPVYLESIGGSSRTAQFVGRVLRKRNATVYTGNPISKLDRAECNSACIFIAAGAVRRFLSGIGLHDGVFVEDRGRKGEVYSPVDGEVDKRNSDYLRDMGIDDEVFNLTKSTPNQNIHLIFYNPDFSLQHQLIYRLGFRMEPSGSENKNIFQRYVRDERGFRLSKIKLAAFNQSYAATRDLIKRAVSIADGSEPDFKSAIKWSEYGVKIGDTFIMYDYAVALGNGYYGFTNKQRAMQLYQSAAEKGFGPAQNNLGWHYYTGDGVEKNIPLAVHWITQAASQDNNFAYGSLCEMYGAGDVFPRDDLEAFKWCQLAAFNMPAGKARSVSEEILAMLSSRMTERQIDRAAKRLLDWVPFKVGEGMGNVEDW